MYSFVADVLFLTVGGRADAHSAFGEDHPYEFYPKAAVSYVISEHGFFPGAAAANGGVPVGAAPGVFAAGTAKRPGEVSSCVKDATAAVLKAIQTVSRR